MIINDITTDKTGTITNQQPVSDERQPPQGSFLYRTVSCIASIPLQIVRGIAKAFIAITFLAVSVVVAPFKFIATFIGTHIFHPPPKVTTPPEDNTALSSVNLIACHKDPHATIPGHNFSIFDVLRRFSYDDWETRNDFFPLIFPTYEQCSHNPKAPVLTIQTARQLKDFTLNHFDSKAHLLVGIALRQYGLAVNAQEVRRPGHLHNLKLTGLSIQREEPQRHEKWLSNNNGRSINRITRILQHLVIVGETDLAKKIESTMNGYKSEQGFNEVSSWKEAISNPGKKRSHS